MINKKSLSKTKHVRKKKSLRNKKRRKKTSLKTILCFFIFEGIFTICTFPFILLYGPFETAKSTYVGRAMSSMSHQYLATMFLSDEKIRDIQAANIVESFDENTDKCEIDIPKIKDDSVDLYELTDNPRFSGYYVVIKDPTRIKIGCTSKMTVEGETTSQIAQNNDAVAAINGGAFEDPNWAGNGGMPSGIVMSEGNVIFTSLNDDVKSELVAFDKEGVMSVGKYSLNELKEMNVMEAVSFNPTLIVNGNLAPITGDGGWGISSRSAIGQKKDGSVILLAIDGTEIGTRGATIKEVQEIMHKLGAVNAINLDGGRSTTLYYDGEVKNTPLGSMGERAIATAIIVK